MLAVHIPRGKGLVGGRRDTGVPVVNVAGHEKCQLQYLSKDDTEKSLINGFNTIT